MTSKRSGKSLIEMVVVISAMSVLLTVAGRLLHQLSFAERTAREGTTVGRGELRLARDFRADVRRARSVEPLVDEKTSGVRIQSDDGAIDYVVQPEAIVRYSTIANRPQQESYRLGPTTIAWLVEKNQTASIEVEPRRDAGTVNRAAAGPLRIVARIGADRFGAAVEQNGEGQETREPAEAAKPRGDQ